MTHLLSKRQIFLFSRNMIFWLFQNLVCRRRYDLSVQYLVSTSYVCCMPTLSLQNLVWPISLLWPPYVIEQAIIFLPCGFFLSIFYLYFSSRNRSGRRLDVYHTSKLDVALVWTYNAGLKCAARGSLEIQDAKIRQKSPSANHRTTLLGYIFATKACIDNRKTNLLNSNIFSTCPHNMVNFRPLTAEIIWWVWGTPANFNGFPLMVAGCNNMQDDSADPAARNVAAFTSNNRTKNKEQLPLIDAELAACYVVHGRGCNPHRSLRRHWWRHNCETIEKNRDHLSPWNPLSYPTWKPHRSTTSFAKPEMTSFMTS